GPPWRRRARSADLPVELVHGVDGLIAALERRELYGLLAAQAEEPETPQAVVEQAMHALLQRPAEIDEYVSAQDRVELVEGAVGDQVVLGEDHVAAEARVERRRAVPHRVVLRERPPAARGQVAGGVLPHDGEGEGPALRLLQRALVHVGGVDLAAV